MINKLKNKIKSAFNIFKVSEQEKRLKNIKKKCGCVCYCPKCKEPLNDQECRTISEDGLYEYTCKCGEKPMFHFGIAPVPIFIEKDIK